MSDQLDLECGGGMAVSLGPIAKQGRMTGISLWAANHVERHLTPDEVEWLIAQLQARQPKKPREFENY